MAKRGKQLNVQQVLDDPDLRLWAYGAPGDMLVVSFSGVGPDANLLPVPEFVRSATGSGKHSALFFADPKRSWLNEPGLIEKIVALIEAQARQMGAKRIVTVGHSMGGFMAAILPAFTKVDVAVCLSPQVSVDPAIVPNEKRWMTFRKHIGAIRISSIADYVIPSTRYYVFFGDHKREDPQRHQMPVASNIKSFLIPQTTHDTPQRMKRVGVLDEIVQFSFEGRTRLVRRILKDKLDGMQVVPAKDDAPVAQQSNIGQQAPEGESTNDQI